MAILRRWRNPYMLMLPIIIFIPFIISVSKLQQRFSVQEETKIKSKKSDHLILGPAAGHGLPDRIQCDGLKAVNKINFQSSLQSFQARDTVYFVTMYTIYNISVKSDSVNSEVTTVGNKIYTRIERSMAILNTFIDFIQVSMPKSNVIILTDPASDFMINRKKTRILPIQGDYTRGNLMLQRIKSYIAFLEGNLVEHSERLTTSAHYIFVDSDIAVVDDLSLIFQKYPNFDLALTFRNNKDQPLNSGFLAVRGTSDSILKAKTFLQEVLDVYSSKFMKASRMLGDQLALAWVVKSYFPDALKKFSKHEAFSGNIHRASVLFLPCAIYNWTPPEGAGQFHGMPLNVQIVHFKGSRKRLMLESWNFYNATSNMSDMLCLILKSGRTKYDF